MGLNGSRLDFSASVTWLVASFQISMTFCDLTGDIAVLILHIEFFDLCVGIREDILFLRRNLRVNDSDGDTGNRRILIAECFNLIEDFRGCGCTVDPDTALDDFGEHTLLYELSDFEIELMLALGTVNKTEVLRNNFVEDEPADRTVDDLGDSSVALLLGDTDFNLGVKRDIVLVVRHHRLIDIAEALTLAGFAVLDHRQVIGAEDHVLCRDSNRHTIGGLEEVVCREHEEAGFGLCLGRKREVDSHLVAVEVRIERGTDERMELNGTTLYEYRLKCLDTESMEGRCTVEHDGVILDDIFECIPDIIVCAVNHLACALDVLDFAGIHQPFQYKGFKEFECHLLRKTALIHFQLRTDNDNGTSGIVNTLTEEVLTEAALLTFQHIGKGLECTVIGAGYRSAMSAVVDEGVHSFLKHTLFIADDDIGRVELKHSAQTVITVDDTAVEVIEVRSCISSAVEHNHRTDIGRDDRNDGHDHPFGAVAGEAECLDNFETLEKLDTLLGFLGGLTGIVLRIELSEFFLEFIGDHVEVILPLVGDIRTEGAVLTVMFELTVAAGFALLHIERQLSLVDEVIAERVIAVGAVFLEEVEDCLGTHFCGKGISAVFFDRIVIFLLGEELLFHETGFILTEVYGVGLTGIGYDIFCKVEDFFEPFLGDFKNLSDTGRCALEVPDMGNGRGKFNMTHTFAADFCAGYLDAAAVTDLTLEADFLKFTAVAFPILCRSEDSFTEKTALFRLLCTIVDGFGTFHNTIAPAADLFRGCQTDFNGIKGRKFQSVPS